MKEKIHYVPKFWGYEQWFVNNDKYCGKLLFFIKGKMCSWHVHFVKTETMFIRIGKIQMLWSDHSDDILQANSIILEAGDVFHIPPNRRHRMIALFDTEIFEFSTHHDDDDSIKILKG